MPIQIRPATVDDAAPACAVICASIRECCADDHHHEPQLVDAWLRNKTPAFLQSLIEAPDNFSVVAQGDAQVLGFAMSSGVGSVMLCYAAPAARFSGVGKAMLTALERHAVQSGATTLYLESTRTALAFYLRHGFVPEGLPIQAFCMEGQPMRKSLAAPPI